MSSSNCCFLTCIQISQEAGKVICYSHLFQNFPQFVVIHTVKGNSPKAQSKGVFNKAEVDIFLELSYFFDNPTDVGNLISGSSAFSNSSLNIWRFSVHELLKHGLENFEPFVIHVIDTFSMIQQMLAIWSLVPLPFKNPACTFGSSLFMCCWSLAWKILSINFLACEMNATVW